MIASYIIVHNKGPKWGRNTWSKQYSSHGGGYLWEQKLTFVWKVPLQIQIIKTQNLNTDLAYELFGPKKEKKEKDGKERKKAYYKSETVAGKQKSQNIIQYKTALYKYISI